LSENPFSFLVFCVKQKYLKMKNFFQSRNFHAHLLAFMLLNPRLAIHMIVAMRENPRRYLLSGTVFIVFPSF
jgi:hypothetical protein